MSTDIPDRTRKLIQSRADNACEICRKPMTDIHHRQRKGMGGTSSLVIHNPENLIGLCRWHHGWTHANPAHAVLGGWIVPTTVDPEFFPVWAQNVNYGYSAWFSLLPDGCVRWVNDLHEPLNLPPGMPSLSAA